MAVPKRKMSRSNTRHRRSAWKTSVTSPNPVGRAAGVIVTVRFCPLPPKVIFAFATTDCAEETADTVKFPAAVIVSFTVNAIGPPAWSA